MSLMKIMSDASKVLIMSNVSNKDKLSDVP
jgi:hypothetical protein